MLMLNKFVILSVTMCFSLLTVITITNFTFFFPFLLNVLGCSSLVSQVNQNPFSFNNNNNTSFRF